MLFFRFLRGLIPKRTHALYKKRELSLDFATFVTTLVKILSGLNLAVKPFPKKLELIKFWGQEKGKNMKK